VGRTPAAQGCYGIQNGFSRIKLPRGTYDEYLDEPWLLFIGTSGIGERGTGKQAESDQITKPLDAA
jgi:hypothetical protein